MEWSWHPVQLSLFVATIATIMAFFMAILIAYLMTAKELKGRSIIETMLMLPLVLPPTVIGFLLLIIFGKNSIVGETIKWLTGESLLFTVLAAIIAATVVSFPLMYQSIKAGFMSVDQNVKEAAIIDGANDWQLLIFIILPLTMKSVLTGIILGFARAFGEFGATLMFAGNIPGKTQTVPTAIYLAFETDQTHIAWYYVVVSMTFSFLLITGVNRVRVDK